MKKKNQFGFTLSELMIALTITVVIFILTISTYILSQRAFRKCQIKYELIQNSRVFIDKITRELRQSPEIATALPETYSGAPSEIMFQNGHDTSTTTYIRYYLSGTELKRQTLHYYFIGEEETYVRWDELNEFEESPESSIDEDTLISEHINTIVFFGEPTITNILANFSKNQENNYIYTTIYGRNL